MASNLMLDLPEGMELEKIAQELADIYQAKGFTVRTTKSKNAVNVVFDKGVGGINMILGMGVGIKATLTARNGTLSVNYSDADWTGKIIGFIVGWFICGIPVITAGIGTMKQLSLPKDIDNDITMIVG